MNTAHATTRPPNAWEQAMAALNDAPSSAPFTGCEQMALRALRDRFGADQDCFTGAERARLRFVRWLVQSGQVQP